VTGSQTLIRDLFLNCFFSKLLHWRNFSWQNLSLNKTFSISCRSNSAQIHLGKVCLCKLHGRPWFCFCNLITSNSIIKETRLLFFYIFDFLPTVQEKEAKCSTDKQYGRVTLLLETVESKGKSLLHRSASGWMGLTRQPRSPRPDQGRGFSKTVLTWSSLMNLWSVL
jgi:hypothetical protein